MTRKGIPYMLNGESERQRKEPKAERMVHRATRAAIEDKQRPFVPALTLDRWRISVAFGGSQLSSASPVYSPQRLCRPIARAFCSTSNDIERIFSFPRLPR